VERSSINHYGHILHKAATHDHIQRQDRDYFFEKMPCNAEGPLHFMITTYYYQNLPHLKANHYVISSMHGMKEENEVHDKWE